VYVKCTLAECEKRDVKGMYEKARAGEIKDFTGIDHPFEEPDSADIIVETDKQTVEESKDIVIKALASLGYLPNKHKR
jgi:adenylylsulfate kinase